MRHWELDSKVAGFVEKALPPGALQPWDQNHMKKVVAFVGGQEHLLQACVRHGGRKIPQKACVGLSVGGDPNSASVSIAPVDAVTLLEPSLGGEGFQIRVSSPAPHPVQKRGVSGDGGLSQVQVREHVLSGHHPLHEVSA